MNILSNDRSYRFERINTVKLMYDRVIKERWLDAQEM